VTVAARGSQRLMVGFRAGIAVTPAVRLFAARHPDVLVDVQRIEWDDQATMLGSPARSASVICSRPASRWPAGSTATRGSVYSGVTRRPASSMGSRT
jgi:hypothetical protein